MNKRLLALIALTCFTFPAHAAEPLPGDACAAANNLQFSSGPEVSGGGGHAMLCQGGTWKSVLSFNSAAGLTKLGNQTCATNEILKFNGTTWACAADEAGSGGITALTGEVTASGTGSVAAMIAANAITNAKMADDAIGIAELSATGTANATTYLRGDNTWQTLPSGTPAGSTTHLQFNDAGVFAGDGRLTFTKADGTVLMAGSGFTALNAQNSSSNGRAVTAVSYGTGVAHGGYFQTSSTSGGAAVFGTAPGTTGSVYGGYFATASTGGTGVTGGASASSGTTYGGQFSSASSSGVGVLGTSSSSTGTTYGGNFLSFSNAGSALIARAGTAATKTIIAQGAPSQTANLAEFQAFGGALLSSVSSAGVFTGPASGLTGLNASNLASGTVAAARLGSGTANATTYLRGDNTWASIAGGDNLGNHTATTTLNMANNHLGNVGQITGSPWNANYDIWIQGGVSAATGGARNLALLGLDEDGGDTLHLNFYGEYSGGTRIGGFIADPAGNIIRDANGGWVRTYGATGWYSQTYGGGWNMEDTTWLRAYGGKAVYTPNVVRADAGIQTNQICNTSGTGCVAQSSLGGAGGGISATTVATCSYGGFGSNCTVNCPATYYRTGCNVSVQTHDVYPSGAGCACGTFNNAGTCYAICAK